MHVSRRWERQLRASSSVPPPSSSAKWREGALLEAEEARVMEAKNKGLVGEQLLRNYEESSCREVSKAADLDKKLEMQREMDALTPVSCIGWLPNGLCPV